MKTDNLIKLHILATLPLGHHSLGASLLQTAMRLGFPIGLAITTAVWTSFRFHGEDLMLAYSKAFIATTAFASFSLAIAPFTRIGRQGYPGQKSDKETKQDIEKVSDHRPSKRWSYVETISSKSTMASPKPELPPIRTTSLSSELSMIEKNRNSSRDTEISETAKPKIVWVVCEQCNASRRITDPTGDPAKYFNDICGTLEKPNHDMIMNGRRRFPLVVKNQNINR
ncbi:putative Major facilitator superfamily domain-containing protein [Seiridium cardinale]|uniref:Major facilitator superfamily domain-containing protein n=1 Tax=Seiridium cardinale TaxID=138064 RepID=A0ABR2XS12_9PEZI